ncbi:sensor histidine kinase [Mariniplasma anaerobium]|uniref:histidine kinase n=1 Tax=Mariniplasma anaerobium TaxID=2735436 RepID=A0A7U9XW25_9MOLU|nr:ATP-binding protein [Mariniplasma anaerobium]BCR35916.1 two-component sensor histidine kinase [Mariniplasma anaerobium]
MFKNIKKSFIKKLFLSLTLLYILIFLVIFLFQSTVFEQFYTNRTINTTKNEIENILPLESVADINEIILDFSQETQTTSLLVPTNSLTNQLGLLQLQIVEVIQDNITYEIYMPNHDDVYLIGSTVDATIVYHAPTERYIPVSLSVNGERIIHSGSGRINPMFSDYSPDLDLSSTFTITGEILSSEVIKNTTQSPINPIISNEILNILSENYEDLTVFSESSYYYVSTNETNNEQSLVYFVNTSIEDTPYTLIAVYPMSQITRIVSAVRTLNIYTFIIVVGVLMIAAFFYSKQFSKPLVTLNNAAKKLSNLDFSHNPITIETKDEFQELAFNINTLSANLEMTLSQLSKQNKQLSQSLEIENKNDERRKEFIRGMSHELKTPLSVIQASSEALEHNLFETKAEQTKQLKLIQQEIKNTNKMIKNMMLVYQSDTPQYKQYYQKFYIDNLIEQVVSRLQLLAFQKELEIKMDLLHVELLSDPQKLELVLSNLLTNAIKYTPTNETIEIKVIQDKNDLTISVTNYGITIPDEEIERLFEPFYRVSKERSRHEGSTGLGLYIVNQTLNQFRSECHVKNVEKGVHFWFTIQIL